MNPVPEGEVTVGELGRSLAAMENRMNGRLAGIEQRLDTRFVDRREFEIQLTTIAEDVRDLRESKQWMQRTLVAAFLFPVLVAIIVALVVTR